MAEDETDPTRREFQRAVADERLGVPADAALRPIARRMRCSDIEQLALVATLNQRTGGNMAEVLDVIAAGARERADLRRELRALTAQARLSRGIVTALPVGLLAVLTAINPSYVSPLFNTTGGIIALCVATGLVMTGWLVMRAMVPSEE
jgi:tight adherence protein B